MISLTITREALTLDPLVLSDDPAGDFVLSEDGLGEPDVVWEYGYAPKSGDMHGRVLLAATKDMSTLPFVVTAQSTTTGGLYVLKRRLANALEQWAYTITLDVDGEIQTFTCDPTSPRWGDLDSGMVRAFKARASVVVPVYPIGA